MILKTALWTAVLLLSVCEIGANAQEKVVSPKPGDPIRKTLFNVMRPAFEKDLKQKVIFQVGQLKVQREWAFLEGTPLRPNGKQIDYRHTVYQDAIDGGAFGYDCCALLHKTNGKWKLVTYNIGATDVVWEPWAKQYHAPPAIFK